MEGVVRVSVGKDVPEVAPCSPFPRAATHRVAEKCASAMDGVIVVDTRKRERNEAEKEAVEKVAHPQTNTGGAPVFMPAEG